MEKSVSPIGICLPPDSFATTGGAPVISLTDEEQFRVVLRTELVAP
jgi:hypothetical protein